MNEIYLDHNATTPCAPEVIEAMLPYLSRECGNPSSLHRMGQRALTACEQARHFVAQLIDCRDEEIFFTSGATESNNTIFASLRTCSSNRNKVVTTTVEHKSTIEPCRALSNNGIEVVEIPVDSQCALDLEMAENAIDNRTTIVSAQGANNEVGALMPLRELASIAHARGALFHCDAAQMLGKVPVSCMDLGIDFASFSGHKVYGPKGVGILFARGGDARNSLSPLLLGGGQEKGLRSGTLNVPGIVGLGTACRLAWEKLSSDAEKLQELRSLFEAAISLRLPAARINASRVKRLPGTTSVTIPGVPASALIANLPHLCIADGSACNSGAPEPSRVLLAMGMSWDDAQCTVRISFGRGNSQADASNAALSISEAADQITFLMRRSVT